MVNWHTSKEEHRLLTQVADRAVALAFSMGVTYAMTDCLMDLTACHANGMRLDLRGLLGAAPGDFGHDVFGIRRHINRETGKLQDCFVPRYCEKNAVRG